MKDLKTKNELSCDEFDEHVNPAPEEVGFERVLDKAMTRRGFLGGALMMSTSAFLVSAGLPLGMREATAAEKTEIQSSWTLDFKEVAANTQDTVTVPEGFSWQPVVSWGDPLWSKGQAFDDATLGTAETQALAFGDNNDGMDVFVTPEGRTILVANNEYLNLGVFYSNRESQRPESEEDVRKGQMAHGVSVVEIAQNKGRWSVVKDSEFNRRITAQTPMDIEGPARGHEWMKTTADPEGVRSLGTWNNCGNGRTPWGTYLACEENFNGYFSSSDKAYKVPSELKRYGVGLKDRGYAWAQYDTRFDISKEPNEPNRNGYVVEIDPMNPNSTPRKLTALGRFKHENAEVVIAKNGHIVVYMGDDERGEFLYKFVSKAPYKAGGDTSKLLQEGQLYVAKFHDDSTGEWLALTPKNTGMSEAEICIHTRIAASKVGATTMDRPEWVAADPHKPQVYCSLTNNKNRGVKPNKGGDEQPVGGPNPREVNHYGQIVRWTEKNDDHTATAFDWDLFVLAGNPVVHEGLKGGSQNVHAGNMFNSPDGLNFDDKGGLWIQTDGKYSNKGDFEGMGNNQMLLGNTETGEIKRFMVGPKECEITGLSWSADKKTVFVGIQHPGEKGDSHFPRGGNSVPRSTIIAVMRDDGSEIV